MNFIFPLIHIVGETTAKTVDKLNFRRNKIAPQQLMLLVFIGMSASLFIYILLARLPLPAFTSTTIILLASIGLISFAGNIFDFLSLKHNDLSLREPMLGFEPIIAGLFGYLVFPDQREIKLLIAFILGAVVVHYGTHRRTLKRSERKGMAFLLLAVIFCAPLPSIYNLTLAYVSPEYMSFFRVTTILVLSLLFFRNSRQRKSFTKGGTIYGLTSGFIYSIGTVASLYAIQSFGVVIATLLGLLGPTLTYLVSYFVLQEKVRRGEVISSLALALIVVVALVL